MASTARLGDKLKIWDFAGPAGLVGAIALASGLWRWQSSGLNAETAVPIGLGLAMIGLAMPALMNRTGVKMPAVRLPQSRLGLGIVAGVAVVAAGGYAVMRTGVPAMPQLGSLSKVTLLPGGAPDIEGRASVLSGDALRVNGSVFKLAGIEAPERTQTCLKPGNRRWRCSEAAVAALEKLARSRTVKCKPAGSADATGRTPATCTVDGRDIAGELVKGGHVFSTSTMFGGYASQEGDARAAKVGVWNGTVERPGEYRTKVWDDAKKGSPDGCPIKAVANGSSKIYVLPWSRDYKKTTVRPSKGERWFCSEADAAAAGFRASERG